MSVPALLHELEAAGIRLHRIGVTLRAEIPPGASLDPFRDRIRASKPALLTALQARDALAAPGLAPAPRWVTVSRDPVDATVPPASWEEIAPVGCGVPRACEALGPCRHFTQFGRCWKTEGAQFSRDAEESTVESCPNPERDRDQGQGPIVANTPVLRSALALQAQIVTAATVEPATFDREAYDALWARWKLLDSREAS